MKTVKKGETEEHKSKKNPEKARPKEETPEDTLKREFFEFLERKGIPFIDFSVLKISRLELLGQGGFTKVYKGLFFKTPVAIREYLNINLFDGRRNDDDGVSCFTTLNEISNAMSLNFPKFNRCYGVSLNDQGSLFTVHELLESSLRNKLKDGSLTTIQQKHDIAEQILQIMLILQKSKVIHCNLKPSKFPHRFGRGSNLWLRVHKKNRGRFFRRNPVHDSTIHHNVCAAGVRPPGG